MSVAASLVSSIYIAEARDILALLNLIIPVPGSELVVVVLKV